MNLIRKKKLRAGCMRPVNAAWRRLPVGGCLGSRKCHVAFGTHPCANVDPDVPISLELLRTKNTCPVASAGVDLAAEVGDAVVLDASMSTDLDGGPLTFFWEIVASPAGSKAKLSDPGALRPQFTIDTHGRYVVQLTSYDKAGGESKDTISAVTGNSPPVCICRPRSNVCARREYFA